jgi:hypothetical protein
MSKELVVFRSATNRNKILAGVVKKKTKNGLLVTPANEILNLSRDCLDPFSGLVDDFQIVSRTKNVDIVRRAICSVLLVDRQYYASMKGIEDAHRSAVDTVMSSLVLTLQG